MDRIFSVYTLHDGSTNRIFYVGKALYTRRRYHTHMAEARHGHECHRCRKIRKLLAAGVSIVQTIVYQTLDEDDALAHEAELISLLGKERLTNTADGGRGPTGYHHTDEWKAAQRERFRGRPIPEEQKRKLSEAQIGRRMPDERRAKLSAAHTGMKRSPEHRANIRRAMVTRMAPPEVRQQQAEYARQGWVKRHAPPPDQLRLFD